MAKNKNKMTRHQMLSNISKIIHDNIAAAEKLTDNHRLRKIHLDLAFLAKCVRYVERQPPIEQIQLRNDIVEVRFDDIIHNKKPGE
jgi:hypothetical protein